ncbi:TonB-dependent receptor [Pedobacter sp. BMA]|uniref:TonB-dependent receptor n=1 Tax=Pedobacter sp. BMA TaxID=1663685 RepID=UPI00069EDAEE|nr:TonB-dependent receptor [Pedobacter sp. BMA]
MKYYYLILFAFVCNLNVKAQDIRLSGTVTSMGLPIANINIQLPALKKLVKSDNKGHYYFEDLPKGEWSIVFSGIGYQNRKLKLDLNQDTVVLDLEMINLSSELDEVVVTGVNRATQLRKNPVPIAVLNKSAMNQNMNTNLIDAIVKGIPGVSAVTTGPNVSKPFIRGLGYNRVLTLYDGLRQEGQQWGDEHGIEVDEYGIARVEVIKGPASLTYGSDALAGVINMIPDVANTESASLDGDFTSNYQSNNGMYGASLGLNYNTDHWKFSARATSKAAHNYYNKIDRYVYGTAFKEYNLSGSAVLDQSGFYSKTAVTFYNNLMEIPDGSRDSITRRFTVQTLDEGDDIRSRPVVGDESLKKYSINPLHQHIQHFRLYNSSRLKFRNSDLHWLIGGQQSVRKEFNHPTAPDQAGLYVVLNTLNYDVKYNLPDFSGFESTIGINGMYQTNRSKSATDFPIPDYNLFDIGAFYFIKKTFDKLDISGGVRVDRRNTYWNNFYVGTDPDTGFGKQVTSQSANSNLQFPSFDKSYYGMSGSLGFTYNISKRVVIKANIARGYRAPNITEIGSNGLDPGAHIVYLGNRNFKPEFNLQQDLGTIAYLKDLDISLEVFNNHIQNYIYQSRLTDENGNPVVIVPGNLTYQYQQSKARLYGTEFSVNLHPSSLKWLSLNNSIAYVTGINQNSELLRLHGRDARYLPFIPPLQIRSELKLTAQKQSGLLDKPFIKMDVAITSAQHKFYALDNTETFTSGYTLFNAGIGSAIRGKSGKRIAEVFFQAENIFNIAYQSHLNRLKYFEYYQSSPNGRSGIYNMGRNFSFKLVLPF